MIANIIFYSYLGVATVLYLFVFPPLVRVCEAEWGRKLHWAAPVLAALTWPVLLVLGMMRASKPKPRT